MADEKPDCFVIAPIGAEKSDARTRSDQILKHVIRPVADECGYKAVRADEISEPGSITTQVINRILNAPMVVADLTDMNANVFYELAIRHAIRKPYVQIIQKGQRIPFDTAGIRTIELDHTNLDSVATAKDEMKRQMQFAAANPAKVESPITAAVDLASLSQSENPLDRRMGDVLKALSELKALIDDRIPEEQWRPVGGTLFANDVARQVSEALRPYNNQWSRVNAQRAFFQQVKSSKPQSVKTMPPPAPLPTAAPTMDDQTALPDPGANSEG